MASVASSPGASTRPQTRLARWVGGAIVSRGRRILYDKARSARKRTQSDIFCQHGLLAQLPARPPQSAVKCNLVRLNALSLGSGAFNPPIVAFSLSGDRLAKKRKPAGLKTDGIARNAGATGIQKRKKAGVSPERASASFRGAKVARGVRPTDDAGFCIHV